MLFLSSGMAQLEFEHIDYEAKQSSSWIYLSFAHDYLLPSVFNLLAGSSSSISVIYLAFVTCTEWPLQSNKIVVLPRNNNR